MNYPFSKLLFALIALPFFARAHVEVGTYQGTTQYGQECSMDIESVTFEGNIHQPLNERVVVTSGLSTFELRHLPVIDLENSKVSHEPGVLKGAVATKIYNRAFILTMSHTEGSVGPQDFSIVQYDREMPGASETMRCSGLKKKP